MFWKDPSPQPGPRARPGRSVLCHDIQMRWSVREARCQREADWVGQGCGPRNSSKESCSKDGQSSVQSEPEAGTGTHQAWQASRREEAPPSAPSLNEESRF